MSWGVIILLKYLLIIEIHEISTNLLTITYLLTYLATYLLTYLLTCLLTVSNVTGDRSSLQIQSDTAVSSPTPDTVDTYLASRYRSTGVGILLYHIPVCISYLYYIGRLDGEAADG